MIYEKLLKLQQQNITLVKNADNPYFKSKYVPLNQVLEAVKKPLNDMGVVIIQSSQVDGLKTILYDTEDKTSVESVVPYVALSDPQKLGGNITYNRRYSLVALLGLEDEDDDGNYASGKTDTPPQTRVENNTIKPVQPIRTSQGFPMKQTVGTENMTDSELVKVVISNIIKAGKKNAPDDVRKAIEKVKTTEKLTDDERAGFLVELDETLQLAVDNISVKKKVQL